MYLPLLMLKMVDFWGNVTICKYISRGYKKGVMNRFLLFSFFIGFLHPSLSQAEDNPKYLDPSVPIEQRIDDLLPRLTVEEKIIEISDDWGSRGIPRLKVPALLKTE